MRKVLFLVLVCVTIGHAQGVVERSTDLTMRPVLTGAAAGVPSTRGAFVFVPPYGTQGYRLTQASDCPSTRPDCVAPLGYGYWSNLSRVGDVLYAFVTLREAGGPTAFAIDTRTHVVSKLGPLFTDARQLASGEGWRFSAGQPTKLYVTPSTMGRILQRVDILTRQTEEVFDITARFGEDHYVWQTHSSADDAVHSFALRDRKTFRTLGCGVYIEPTRAWKFFADAAMDECQVDKSGRWLVIKSQVDGLQGEDNRIVNLDTDTEVLLLDPAGAGGHSDNGHGLMIARDNWSRVPSVRLWQLGAAPAGPGTVVYQDPSWAASSLGHLSFAHARRGPIDQQYACGSNLSRLNAPRVNEVVCVRLDGSLSVLTIAPVMTDGTTGSAGGDSYGQLPKGNLDATGEYFAWSTNLGTSRTDVVVVRVPWAQGLPMTKPAP